MFLNAISAVYAHISNFLYQQMYSIVFAKIKLNLYVQFIYSNCVLKERTQKEDKTYSEFFSCSLTVRFKFLTSKQIVFRKPFVF